MSVQIKLMINKDNETVIEKAVVDLTNYITAELYDETSIVNPEFKLAWDNSYIKANYLFCDDFKRYYFIDDIVAEPGGAARLICRSDPLTTFFNQYANTPITITRAGDTNSNFKSDGIPQNNGIGPTYIDDSYFPLEVDREIKTYILKNNNNQIPQVFNIDSADAGSYNYILTVCGTT